MYVSRSRSNYRSTLLILVLVSLLLLQFAAGISATINFYYTEFRDLLNDNKDNFDSDDFDLYKAYLHAVRCTLDCMYM